MRILIVSNLFPPAVLGGYELECQYVADHLQNLKHNVAVLTSGYAAGFSLKAAAPPPYPVFRKLKLFLPFGVAPKSSLRWSKWMAGRYNHFQMQRALDRFKPDVVFFWSPLRIGISPARAAMNNKIPVVWRIGDENLAGYAPASFGWSLRSSYAWFCDHILFRKITTAGLSFRFASCISHTVKNNLIAQGIPLENARVHYKSLPIQLFPLKQQPGKLSSPVKLLYVGRLHPSKAIATLIKGAQKAAERIPAPIELTLAGTGDAAYVQELQEAASQGKESLKVNFIGFIPFEQLSPIYQAHDIFHFPSSPLEGQGGTFLEAMSSGLPVISSDKGGHAELLKDEQNALLYPYASAEKLADCIKRLIEDAPLRIRLAKEGRRFVQHECGEELYVRSLESLLYEAAAES